MPFDNPRTFTLDLAGLAAWLETQDPETRYDFMNIGDCLICRFVRAQGLFVSSAGAEDWVDDAGQRHDLGIDDTASQLPHTYDAALERARALL